MPFADPASVTVLCLDVDGVLTDGSITYSSSGDELKTFLSRDGYGLRMWLASGHHAAIVTGRGGEAVRRRAQELGIAPVIEGSSNKAAALDEVCAHCGVRPDQVAHVGDDWPDLAIMNLCGYPISVADAEPLVKSAAAWITPRPGGRGAVRDACEHLLAASGKLDRAVEKARMATP